MIALAATIGARCYDVDIENAIDISIPLYFNGPQPNAFHLPHATAVVAQGVGFIGDTRRGGSCNCETVTLNPHGNGTHTECAGHVSHERLSVSELVRDPLLAAALVTVAVENVAAINRSMIDIAIETAAIPEGFLCALVIRTLPNPQTKREHNYSGTNPAFIHPDGMRRIRELGVQHLLLDLPSADPEDDKALTSHNIFFGSDEKPRRSITEMVYIPNSVEDGAYLLALQLPPFVLDAAPSRPVLLRCTATHS